jgi:hypothetical protein
MLARCLLATVAATLLRTILRPHLHHLTKYPAASGKSNPALCTTGAFPPPPSCTVDAVTCNPSTSDIGVCGPAESGAEAGLVGECVTEGKAELFVEEVCEFCWCWCC